MEALPKSADYNEGRFFSWRVRGDLMPSSLLVGFDDAVRDLGYRPCFHDAVVEWVRIGQSDGHISLGLLGFTFRGEESGHHREEGFMCTLLFSGVSSATLELDGEDLYELDIELVQESALVRVEWGTCGGAHSSLECASVMLADWQIRGWRSPAWKLVLSCHLSAGRQDTGGAV